jgi:hypothetical protein
LIGAAHLVPSWVLKGHDGILAADLGGTNFRAGVVELDLKRASNLSKASVWKLDYWRHVNDKPTRDEAVERLVKMLRKLIARAEEERLDLGPFIGIGCPGVIEEDGTISRGATRSVLLQVPRSGTWHSGVRVMKVAGTPGRVARCRAKARLQRS